jgi:hypothetical protein
MPFAGHATLAPVEALQQQGRKTNGPAVDGRVIDRNAALGHHLLKDRAGSDCGPGTSARTAGSLIVKLTAFEHRNPRSFSEGFLATTPVIKKLQHIRRLHCVAFRGFATNVAGRSSD